MLTLSAKLPPSLLKRQPPEKRQVYICYRQWKEMTGEWWYGYPLIVLVAILTKSQNLLLSYIVLVLYFHRIAKEGPVRIKYKCLVSMYVFPEMNLLFPKQNYNFLSPSSYTHISVRDLYISSMGLPFLLKGNMWTDPGNI
jgi:hypothetical protein